LHGGYRILSGSERIIAAKQSLGCQQKHKFGIEVPKGKKDAVRHEVLMEILSGRTSTRM